MSFLRLFGTGLKSFVSDLNPVPVKLMSDAGNGVSANDHEILTFDILTAADQKTAVMKMPKGDQVGECTMSVTSGTGLATIEWYGSNRNSNVDGHLLATFDITDTSSKATLEKVQNFTYCYFKCKSISGTGAAAVPTVSV